MPFFSSDGVRLAYDDQGTGEPVVLVHGFASNRHVNWAMTNWFHTLDEGGYRAISFDHRGHGQSDKPHDPSAYGDATMAGDVLRLMDHCGVARAWVMGYSLGAYISIELLRRHSDRVRGCVLGGIGEKSLSGGTAHSERIREAMLAPSLEAVTDPLARPYRDFADRQNADRAALAACIAYQRPAFSSADFAPIATPVLVITGQNDEGMGDPAPMAQIFPHGEHRVVPRRDHLNAPSDRRYKEEVLGFFKRT
ncbi:MAG: alpha/beta hydrolase [Pseudomonadota bacterium]